MNDTTEVSETTPAVDALSLKDKAVSAALGAIVSVVVTALASALVDSVKARRAARKTEVVETNSN